MLRNLLVDRFRMKIHPESKEASVYALTVSKKGTKLTPAADSTTACTVKTTPAPDGRNITETFTGCPLDRLADRLGNLLGNQKPVLDKTNLTGLYDFHLTLLPDYRAHNGATDSDIDPQTALAPLGLTLTAQKNSVELLVIDRFEIPKEN
jgi:uncharacterized protein (TIGR03435 family)